MYPFPHEVEAALAKDLRWRRMWDALAQGLFARREDEGAREESVTSLQRMATPKEYARNQRFKALMDKYPDPKRDGYCAVPMAELEAFAKVEGLTKRAALRNYGDWLEQT